MAEGIIGSVGVAVVPDAENFWRRFEAQTSAGAAEAGRRAGNDWQRGFQSGVSDTNVRVRTDVDQNSVSRSVAAIQSRMANLGRITIGTEGLNAGQLASITAATNRLADAQGKVKEARVTLAAVTAKEGHTEEELRAANEAVTRAQRDEQLATLRLAAAQETVAAAQDRARLAAEKATAANAAAAAAAEKNAEATGNSARSHQSLLGILTTLAPALVPLAGAAAAGGAALVQMAVGGGLAIKGIQNDIKAANREGIRFSAGLNVLKTDLQGMEKAQAHNVLGAFEQATAKLHASLPAVNVDLVQQSKVLGDIAGHLLGAGVAGEHTFAPLLLEISQQVDAVAASFESWASGPGGEKFASALRDDFEQVVPVIEDVAGAVARLVAGANGPGLAIVDELGVFARVLDSIPVPVLSALTTGIVSLRVASLVTGLMDRLAVSIRGVAVAEGEATAASRARGGLAGAVGFIGKAAAGYLGATIAVDAYAKATDSARTSTDGFKRIAAQTGHALDELVHLDFKGFGNYLFGGAAKEDRQAQANADLAASYQALVGHIGPWGSASEKAALQAAALNKHSIDLNATLAAGHAVFSDLSVGEASAAERAKDLAANSSALASIFENLHGKIGGGSGITQLAAGFTQAQAAVEANIESGEKFVKLGGDVQDKYKGVNITLGMYKAALAKTGSDAAAIGYIHAQIDALSQNKDALQQLSTEQQNTSRFVSDVGTKYKVTSQQIDVYTAALGLNVEAIARGGSALSSAETLFGKFVDTLRNGSTALGGWLSAVDQWTKSGDTVADRAALIGAALRAANGDTLSYANTMVQAATANQQLVTDFVNLKDGVVNLKRGTIDYHNAGAGPLLSDLSNLQTAAMNAAAATYQHEKSMGNAGAASDAFAVYVNDTRGALIKQAEQLGITKGQARKLADEYFGIKNSGDLKKQIQLIGQDKVLTALQGILADLDLLAGKHVKSYVDVVATLTNVGAGSGHGAGQRTARNATGGFITGPGTATSDSIPAWLSNGEFVVNAKQTAKHRGLLHALNDGAQGFASGGETGGFSGVDYSGNADKYGNTKKTSTAKAKTATFDSSALSSFLQQIGITTNVFAQAKNALVGALKDAKVSARQTAAVARTADRLIAYSQQIQTETDRITKATDYRNNLRDQSRQESDSVRSAFMGLFDLSNAGVREAQQQVYKDVPVAKAAPVSASTILEDLTKSADRASTTRTELKSLENAAKGNKALTAFVQQLAENPQSAQAQIDALSKASKADLQKIGGQFGRLQGAAGGAGGDLSTLLFSDKLKAADALLSGFDPKKNPALARAVDSLSTSLFGAGKETARGLAKGLISERKTLVGAMHVLAHDMEETIRHDLKMRSPSRKFHDHGRNVVAGLVNGIVESLPQARSAAGQLGSTLDLGAVGARRGDRGGDTWQFYGLNDPVAIGTAVARRQQIRSRY